ncbi:hypothetical protein PQS91_10615 [Stenotrophomonas geniculata]|uniref:hypothetical protein n=1 Tax=Stenotrophomonas geniculata TaxID=86188 RepID=UPI00234F4009|nr:hypothetical protein [Stenotrophomonas geniculata]MDC7800300.1 hypothetical protein [Stenotrophomonas geniculata]
MKIDRDVQKKILTVLANRYPDPVDSRVFEDQSPEQLVANFAYLKEHGLIDYSMIGRMTSGPVRYRVLATAKGVDFLADDGGLTAILGVVTIRLDDHTLKAIVASKIEESDLPQEEKNRLANQLGELPGEVTKHLVLKLVDAGLENWHRALPIIQNMLGGI